MAKNPGRRGRPWERLRTTVLLEETHCCHCGHPVNKGLSGQNPWGPTVDHVIPVSLGGPPLDRANVRLAHRKCNCSRGNRMTMQRGRSSRLW